MEVLDHDSKDVTSRILLARTVKEAITHVTEHYGVPFVTFHMVSSIKSGLDNPFVRTTYPPEWVSHYLLNNYVANDPILRRAMEASQPFCWTEVIPANEKERSMFAEAARFGLGRCGYSIPCADPLGRKSVLSFNCDRPTTQWESFVETHRTEMADMSQDLHVKAVAEAFAQQGDVAQLSPREFECLRWTAEGKTYSEIAIILDLSEHTVRSYLKVARLKLDSVSLAQAVAKASRMGLI